MTLRQNPVCRRASSTDLPTYLLKAVRDPLPFREQASWQVRTARKQPWPSLRLTRWLALSQVPEVCVHRKDDFLDQAYAEGDGRIRIQRGDRNHRFVGQSSVLVGCRSRIRRSRGSRNVERQRRSCPSLWALIDKSPKPRPSRIIYFQTPLILRGGMFASHHLL